MLDGGFDDRLSHERPAAAHGNRFVAKAPMRERNRAARRARSRGAFKIVDVQCERCLRDEQSSADCGERKQGVASVALCERRPNALKLCGCRRTRADRTLKAQLAIDDPHPPGAGGNSAAHVAHEARARRARIVAEFTEDHARAFRGDELGLAFPRQPHAGIVAAAQLAGPQQIQRLVCRISEGDGCHTAQAVPQPSATARGPTIERTPPTRRASCAKSSSASAPSAARTS